MTLVEADVPRVMCAWSMAARRWGAWAGRDRDMLLFESFVLSWLKISTFGVVRKQLNLSWNADRDGRALAFGTESLLPVICARSLTVSDWPSKHFRCT